jgi:hypothetical protein
MGDIIQFKPKVKEADFVEMWPNDWNIEYNPTLYELRQTVNTIEGYRYMLMDELVDAGIQSEFAIRDKIQQCDCMLNTLMEYLVID